MHPEIYKTDARQKNRIGILFHILFIAAGLLGFWQEAKADDDSEFEFTGTIQVLPATTGFIGEWTISGRKVRVTSNTELDRGGGQFAVGARVEVEGFLQTDGSVTAKQIELKASGGTGTSFSGTVEVLPNTAGRIGDWTVSGTVVRVTIATLIKQESGAVAVGTRVEVEGARRPDNTVDAYKIEVKSESGGNNNLEFTGTIESLPSTTGRIGLWSVGGRKVNVVAATKISPAATSAAIGLQAKVKGQMRTDTIDATEIEIKAAPATGSVVEFSGIIESLPGTAGQIGAWMISGRRVNVSATTRIETEGAAPAVGAAVEAKGALLGDGSVNATKIEVENRAGQFEFKGTIESLPASINLIGDWRVGGRTIRVLPSTKIERKYGTVAIGAFVEIYGTLLGDTSINAAKIEVKQGPAGGGFVNYNPVTTVSAASYLDDNSPESIVSAFGSNMTTGTSVATTIPLPVNLGGLSVLVDGRQTGLFFVSPNQINYQLPAGTPSGVANVVVMRNGTPMLQGSVLISGISLSLFTANATGTGAPAGLLLRVRANGQQVFESLARFDGQNIVPAPIVRQAGEQLFLILFGTGIKQSLNTDGNPGNGVAENVQATIAGVASPVVFAGSAPGFVGLEQINLRIPDTLPANPNAQVIIKVRDQLNNLKQANSVVISLR